MTEQTYVCSGNWQVIVDDPGLDEIVKESISKAIEGIRDMITSAIICQELDNKQAITIDFIVSRYDLYKN